MIQTSYIYSTENLYNIRKEKEALIGFILTLLLKIAVFDHIYYIIINLKMQIYESDMPNLLNKQFNGHTPLIC